MMKSFYKKIALLLSVFIIILFIIFVINQTAQVVELSKNISEEFSKFVFFTLILIYLLILLIPIYLFLTLPKSPKLPEDDKSPEYKKYLEMIKKRLRKNKYLKEKNLKLESEEELHQAISELNKIADKEIKNNAAGIFTVTALSQSGKLDGLIVLILLTKMIYRIALIYNQRPRMSELIQLYANVFTTSFIAYSIEEIDIAEQLEPVTDNLAEISVIKTLQSIPASGLIAKMLLDGSINAYLAMRVGIITKTYCSSLIKPVRGKLRKSASIQAAKLTVSLVKEIGEKIAKQIGDRLKEKISETSENIFEKGKDIFNKAKDILGRIF